MLHIIANRLGKRGTMDRFKNLSEFGRFELRWKIIFTCFAVIFAGALVDHMLRAPTGNEAVWCYSLGAVAFLGAIWSANVLQVPPWA